MVGVEVSASNGAADVGSLGGEFTVVGIVSCTRSSIL